MSNRLLIFKVPFAGWRFERRVGSRGNEETFRPQAGLGGKGGAGKT